MTDGINSKDDDIDHADLFGEDSSNDGDAPSSSKAGVGKKQSVDCPRYPKIQSDGKVREAKQILAPSNFRFSDLQRAPSDVF